MSTTSKKEEWLRLSNLYPTYLLARYFYLLAGIILFFGTPQLSIAQTFRDCKNAGGKYLDCRPPDAKIWGQVLHQHII